MTLKLPNNSARFFVTMLLALSLPCVSTADESSASMFSFGGFGTAGVVHSTEHQADFTTNIFKPNGAGFSHNWSTDVDTVLAAQVSAHFTAKLSAIIQVVVEQNYDNTYRPHLEWGNLQYQFTPDLTVRLGRTVLPSFLVSDARAVGYANPWVRPPLEVYSLIPFTNSDGGQVIYTVHTGELLHTLIGSFGNTYPELPGHISIESRHNWLIADTIEYGPATLRLTYQQSRLTLDLVNALFAGFQQFGPQGNALASQFGLENKVLKFIGLGGMYDPGRWFVTGEWGRAISYSAWGTSTAWYATGGYRVAKFTPFVTYAQRNSGHLSDPGLTVSALPLELQGPAAELNGALNSLLSAQIHRNTVSVGARWDVAKNVDLKLQFDRIRIGAGSVGGLTNTQPGFRLGSNLGVFSATIDFVF